VQQLWTGRSAREIGSAVGARARSARQGGSSALLRQFGGPKHLRAGGSAGGARWLARQFGRAEAHWWYNLAGPECPGAALSLSDPKQNNRKLHF